MRSCFVWLTDFQWEWNSSLNCELELELLQLSVVDLYFRCIFMLQSARFSSEIKDEVLYMVYLLFTCFVLSVTPIMYGEVFVVWACLFIMVRKVILSVKASLVDKYTRSSLKFEVWCIANNEKMRRKLDKNTAWYTATIIYCVQENLCLPFAFETWGQSGVDKNQNIGYSRILDVDFFSHTITEHDKESYFSCQYKQN